MRWNQQDVRKGSRLQCFLKTTRRMWEIYELHQYKKVFQLLQAMSPEARAAILHNLLMDQNLAGMMRSLSVMLRPLYATSQMNTVARLPTLIDTEMSSFGCKCCGEEEIKFLLQEAMTEG